MFIFRLVLAIFLYGFLQFTLVLIPWHRGAYGFIP